MHFSRDSHRVLLCQGCHISKLQKSASRIILQAEYLTPSSHMFEELGRLSIPRRLMYNKAIFTFKALNN